MSIICLNICRFHLTNKDKTYKVMTSLQHITKADKTITAGAGVSKMYSLMCVNFRLLFTFFGLLNRNYEVTKSKFGSLIIFLCLSKRHTRNLTFFQGKKIKITNSVRKFFAEQLCSPVNFLKNGQFLKKLQRH